MHASFFKNKSMEQLKPSENRRKFLKDTIRLAAGAVAMNSFPAIVPSSVFGRNAPSNKINIGQIGCGRIARTHDLAETFKYDHAHIMAIADVDRNRLQLGKKMVEGWYTKKTGKENYGDIKTYDNYHELRQIKDIVGVRITTPDNWKARPPRKQALPAKQVYLQNQTSLTME